MAPLAKQRRQHSAPFLGALFAGCRRRLRWRNILQHFSRSTSGQGLTPSWSTSALPLAHSKAIAVWQLSRAHPRISWSSLSEREQRLFVKHIESVEERAREKEKGKIKVKSIYLSLPSNLFFYSFLRMFSILSCQTLFLMTVDGCWCFCRQRMSLINRLSHITLCYFLPFGWIRFSGYFDFCFILHFSFMFRQFFR